MSNMRQDFKIIGSGLRIFHPPFASGIVIRKD